MIEGYPFSGNLHICKFMFVGDCDMGDISYNPGCQLTLGLPTSKPKPHPKITAENPSNSCQVSWCKDVQKCNLDSD